MHALSDAASTTQASLPPATPRSQLTHQSTTTKSTNPTPRTLQDISNFTAQEYTNWKFATTGKRTKAIGNFYADFQTDEGGQVPCGFHDPSVIHIAGQSPPVVAKSNLVDESDFYGEFTTSDGYQVPAGIFHSPDIVSVSGQNVGIHISEIAQPSPNSKPTPRRESPRGKTMPSPNSIPSPRKEPMPSLLSPTHTSPRDSTMTPKMSRQASSLSVDSFVTVEGYATGESPRPGTPRLQELAPRFRSVPSGTSLGSLCSVAEHGLPVSNFSRMPDDDATSRCGSTMSHASQYLIDRPPKMTFPPLQAPRLGIPPLIPALKLPTTKE